MLGSRHGRAGAGLVGSGTAVRLGVLAGLVGGYWLAFPLVHQGFGNPAYLLGMTLCVAGGILFGVRGAVAMIVVTVVLDRGTAMSLGIDRETSRAALPVAMIFKVLLGVGTGLVVDSRRRFRTANARLAEEVDARRRSEQSLAASESLHRALVESLGEGVGVFDATDRFCFANPALAAALATPAGALAGRVFSEFLTAESRENLARLRSHPATGPRSYDVVLDDAKSTLLLVTETELPRGASDGPMTLRVVRDLTERVVSERRQRDLEREIQRGQALQGLAVLAGGVAHDFNNLLSGVVGNAELAERRVPPSAPPELAQCLGEIKDFANEAAQLSRQMLAYAGRRSLAVEVLDVRAELGEALRLLHATIESQARLVTRVDAERIEVVADRIQLRQVVTNLVLNALEAMTHQRGTLTIRACKVRLDGARLAGVKGRPALPAGDYVEIAVEDTGSGIAAEVREHIFEPFFSTKSPGRGLGLAATLGIVRAHRGLVEVESEAGEGTRVRILLPAASATAQRTRDSGPPPSGPAPTRRILLIDDEPAVRLVTGRLLTELGQRVVTAESGRRGLDLMGESGASFDLVVLDLTMPELSGAEVLDELRRVQPDVKVILTSGFHPNEAADLLVAPNVVGFLEKPHTLANLEVALASV